MNDRMLDVTDLLAHDAWIRAIARRLVADPASADDVAQRAWMAALEQSGTERPVGRAWLRRVVGNLVRMDRRADERRRQRERAVARADRAPPVDELVAREAIRARLSRAVLELREPYRTAIIYRFFEDLPPRHIAERLGVTVVAVEGRIRRGLAMLRSRLDREHDGDRGSWRAALVPWAGGGVVATATSTPIAVGALVMGSKLKLALAALVIASFGVAIALLPGGDPATPPAASDDGPGRSVEAPEAAKTERAAPGAARVDDVSSDVAAGTSVPVSLPLTPSDGAIVGRLTRGDGSPIEGGTVRALVDAAGEMEHEAIAAVRTEADGRYALRPIAVECIVEASATGCFTARRRAVPHTRQDFRLGAGGAVRGRVAFVADGRPSIGARIGLYRYDPPDAVDRRTDVIFVQRVALAATRTDADGTFVLSDLSPGRYHVRVVPRDGPLLVSAPVVEVLAGRSVDCDIGLSQGYVIEGRVLDHATKRPVAGVVVHMPANPFRRATSDADGRYELRGVGMREYTHLVVAARGWQRHSLTLPIRPENLGRRVTHDLFVARAATVRGRVVGPDGAPVAGARVGTSGVLMTDEDRLARAGILLNNDDVSGADGCFEVQARAGRRPVRIHASYPALAWGATEPIALAAGEVVEDVTIRLERGTVVRGRVVDDRGVPAAGARVTLLVTRGTAPRIHAVSRRTTSSRSDGRYELIGIPAGTYRVEVVPPDLLANGRSRHRVAAVDGVVVASRPVAVDVRLQTGVVLEGRVIDELGRGVGGAAVRVTPDANRGVRYRVDADAPRTAISGEDGRFSVAGLDPETRLNVSIACEGFERHFERGLVAPVTGHSIVLTRTRRIDGRVTYAATGAPATEFRLTGRSVAAPNTGDGVPRAKSIPRGYFSDVKGHFRLDLVPGRYVIEVKTPEGAFSDPIELDVPSQGTIPPCEIDVREGVRLVGSLVRANGDPVARGEVRVSAFDGTKTRRVGRGRTNTEGAFDIRSLPAGTLVVYADGPRILGRLAVASRVTVTAGTTRELRLVLRETARTVLRVVDAERAPIADAAVTLSGPAGIDTLRLTRLDASFEHAKTVRGPISRDVQRATHRRIDRSLSHTGADGCLAPLALIPGRYVVTVRAAGYEPFEGTFQIDGDRSIDVALTAVPR